MHATSNWLDMHVRFRPDAEALYDVSTGKRWTWRELQQEARAWAGKLNALGVAPGDRVGVLALNRGETFALLFACAELGAVLFPMNRRLSPLELQWQSEHAEIAVLLADAPHMNVLPGALSLDDGPGDDTFVGPGTALSDPWILMYTSGSSGKPKGALLTHSQVHWNALNTVMACDLTPSDSTLTFAPLFHTGGMNCLSTPLLHRGGRVVLVPKLDADEALRLIEEEGITTLMGVPTIYQMLADHPDFPSRDLSTVRDALCGGAALPLPLLERYMERSIPLRQGFGLTEVGPNCFSMPHAELVRKSGSVGKPIHHVAARIVRADGTDCAPDEPGELILAGPAVCGGYWRNPEATASSIVDGWFHTGDVLSVDSEGFFYVRGRIKEMYISGGENVYPAEVEASIAALDGVALAAVVGVPDERWGEVGRAFVEPQPGVTLTSDQIKQWLAGRLAKYKQPKVVVVLDALPRMGSGKIDKQHLKTLEV